MPASFDHWESFGSFTKELSDKVEAGQKVESELLEGMLLMEQTLAGMDAAKRLYERLGFRKLCGPLGATGHFGCDQHYVLEW